MRNVVIFQILIIVLLLALQARGQEFSSQFTGHGDADCISLEAEYREGDIPMRCNGVAPYHIYVYYNFYGHDILSVNNNLSNYSEHLNSDSCGDTHWYGEKIEWRLADGVPFACIINIQCLQMRENTDAETGMIYEVFEVSFEYLLVRGLEGFESLNVALNASDDPDIHETAWRIADAAWMDAEKR